MMKSYTADHKAVEYTDSGCQEYFEALRELWTLHLGRGGDGYGTESDPLASVWIAADIAGHTSLQQAISLLSTKVARMSTQLQGDSISDSKLRDTLMDMAAYAIIAVVMLDREGTDTLTVDHPGPTIDANTYYPW